MPKIGRSLKSTFKSENSQCPGCGRTYSEIKEEGMLRGKRACDVLTRDHIIPRSQGGTNLEDNIVIVCFDCNQAKDSRIFDWFGEHYLIFEGRWDNGGWENGENRRFLVY